MKFSKAFERDYKYYMSLIGEYNFCGTEIEMPIYDENGISAKEAFFLFDSKGKLVPTNEHKLLHDLIFIKKCINFQLKQWSEGIVVIGTMCLYNEPLFKNSPEWVKKSLRNLRIKEFKKHNPKIKLEEING